jgi:hypothetical protein
MYLRGLWEGIGEEKAGPSHCARGRRPEPFALTNRPVNITLDATAIRRRSLLFSRSLGFQRRER